MPISPMKDELITMKQARELIPHHPAPSTLVRWHTTGYKGVRLETVMVGGRRYTTKEALQEFADACTVAADKEKEGNQ